MTNKLLFSDIDGTLIQDGCIDKVTLKKIHDFIENGNKFFLCSGRMDYEIEYILKSFNINSSYRISQNGAVIIDSNNHIVDIVYIEHSFIEAILPFLLELYHKQKIHLEFADQFKRYTFNKRPDYIYPDLLDNVIVLDNLDNEILSSKIKPTNVSIMSQDKDFLVKIHEDVLSKYSEVNVVFTSDFSIEISAKLANKGLAISKVISKFYMNVKPKDVFVVGDSENDITMLKMFTNSFAMKRSDIKVKQYAKHGSYKVGDVIDFINNQDQDTDLEKEANHNFVSLKNQIILSSHSELSSELLDENFTLIFSDINQLASYRKDNPYTKVIFEPKTFIGTKHKESFWYSKVIRPVVSFFKSFFEKKTIDNNSYIVLLEKSIINYNIDIIYLNAHVNTPYFNELDYLIKVCRMINPNIIVIAGASSILEASRAQDLGVNMVSYSLKHVNEFVLNKLRQVIKIPLILDFETTSINNLNLLDDIVAIKISDLDDYNIYKAKQLSKKWHDLQDKVKVF